MSLKLLALLLQILLISKANAYVKYDTLDRNWDSAEQYCQTQCGSHLASIHSQSDWDAVLALGGAASGKDMWIGLRDWNNNGGYTWSDNTLWNFGNFITIPNQSPWKSDQPNDVNQECVIIFGGARLWGDTTCGNSKPFICNCCGNCGTSDPTTAPITSSPTTTAPTIAPVTDTPTSLTPTQTPSTTPTQSPSAYPSTFPTKYPSANPSQSPMKMPTVTPSISPTKNPSQPPMEIPTVTPTISPTQKPTNNPSQLPTNNPTKSPVIIPTNNPTDSPVRTGEADIETTEDSQDQSRERATVKDSDALGLYDVLSIVVGICICIICCIILFVWQRSRMEKRKKERLQRRSVIDSKFDEYNQNMSTELARVKSMSSDGEQEENNMDSNEINIEEIAPNMPYDINVETNTNMVIRAVNAEPDVYSDQNTVKMWLNSMGMSEYFELFMSHGFGEDMSVILALTDDDLQSIGMNKMAHRKRILLQIENNKNMLNAENNENENAYDGEQYNDATGYDKENTELYANADGNENQNIGNGIGNDVMTAGMDMMPFGVNTDDNYEKDSDENEMDLYVKSGKVTDGNVDNGNLLGENENESEHESEDSESEQDIDNQMYIKPDKITES